MLSSLFTASQREKKRCAASSLSRHLAHVIFVQDRTSNISLGVITSTSIRWSIAGFHTGLLALNLACVRLRTPSLRHNALCQRSQRVSANLALFLASFQALQERAFCNDITTHPLQESGKLSLKMRMHSLGILLHFSFAEVAAQKKDYKR